MAQALGGVRVWLLAIRPRTLTAAMAPVLVGTGLAAADGVVAFLPALAALVGAVLIQVATNLANDYFDFVKGSDTPDRIGPTRVTQAGLLTPPQVWRGTVVTLLLATAVGAYLVWVGGWPILMVGLLSLVLALAYTGGPFPLAYHGLGDLFVFLFFGPVAVGGTYWVQGFSLPPDVLLAGIAMGALNTAILVANNLRDRETDARVGKRTLAVRMGDGPTQWQYAGLLGVGLLAPLAGLLFLAWHPLVLASWAGLLRAVPLVRRVFQFRQREELGPVLGGTARMVGIYGALLALGLAAAAAGG